MARLVASELGEEEIEEPRENYSYGANSIRDGISLGSQRVTRPIVSYPQILELKDLTCFLRLPGNYPIAQLELELEAREKNSKGFIERELPSFIKRKELVVADVNESSEEDAVGSEINITLPDSTLSTAAKKKKPKKIIEEQDVIEFL
jgi:type IV secretory pathway TraG/TraD family ATPase VirD4